MPDEKTSPSRFVQRVADALTKTLGPEEHPPANGAPLNDEETHTLGGLLRSGTPHDPDDTRTSEERLIETLDCQAERFVALLSNDERDESGRYIISFDLRLDIFKMAMQWVATRRRTGVTDPNGDQSGVHGLQREMRDAKNAAAAPGPKRGRPTKEVAAARQAAAEKERQRALSASRSDDSGLSAELQRATGSGPA